MNLVEKFAEKPFAVAVVHPFFLRERFVEFAFFGGKFLRNLHAEGDDEIAFPAIRKLGSAVSAETDGFAVLGTGLDFDFALAYYRNHDLTDVSEDHFDRIEVKVVVEVGAVAFETVLGFRNRKMEIEVAIAVDAFVAFAADLDGHAVLNARRDVDFPLGTEDYVTLSATFSARMLDDFAIATALGARDGLFDHAEHRLHALLDTASTRAIGTRFGFAAFFAARTCAIGADLPPFISDVFASALHAFLESRSHSDFDIVSHFAALGTSGLSESPAEKRFENVREIEIGRKTSRTGTPLVVRNAAGTVVIRFFLRIRKSGVRFVHLFEFGFLRLVALMAVGMELHRLFSVGLLELFGRDVATDAEQIVKFVCHKKNVS